MDRNMVITSVRVGRLKTGSGYNNYRVEVEAALQAGEDPAELRERLTAWCDDQIAREEGQQRQRIERENLAWQVGTLEKQRDELRAKVIKGTEIVKAHEKLLALAREHKLDIPGLDQLFDDEMPF
jgi:hypothetical protein